MHLMVSQSCMSLNLYGMTVVKKSKQWCSVAGMVRQLLAESIGNLLSSNWLWSPVGLTRTRLSSGPLQLHPA